MSAAGNYFDYSTSTTNGVYPFDIDNGRPDIDRARRYMIRHLVEKRNFTKQSATDLTQAYCDSCLGDIPRRLCLLHYILVRDFMEIQGYSQQDAERRAKATFKRWPVGIIDVLATALLRMHGDIMKSAFSDGCTKNGVRKWFMSDSRQIIYGMLAYFMTETREILNMAHTMNYGLFPHGLNKNPSQLSPCPHTFEPAFIQFANSYGPAYENGNMGYPSTTPGEREGNSRVPHNFRSAFDRFMLPICQSREDKNMETLSTKFKREDGKILVPHDFIATAYARFTLAYGELNDNEKLETPRITSDEEEDGNEGKVCLDGLDISSTLHRWLFPQGLNDRTKLNIRVNDTASVLIRLNYALVRGELD
ncbi:uncharacterized protein BP5553_01435 [Venustampulla echinocandica]|uniref:Uncharacterized protein n=1 Tax=Venustampulla echinocandica TaxID=2656787 RepID=A0A370U103_9HELO|nr:uncharacterized protein BP5553_01435 [Venustampulla echinocandica]RDL41456.1 hypothetical protein BP5553_01435 [Venustampulla echinocandica]